MDENIKKLRDLLVGYSKEDLLRSFFVLNLWLPNIASPIKAQYLYVLFEVLYNELGSKNKILIYNDFKLFCERVIEYLPSFYMIEDYVPEPDWGDINYFYDDRTYKIFYGGDLSNSYDYYYSFEIMHKTFEKYYLENLKRSPFTEFEFCLSMQHHILTSIPQAMIDDTSLSPGDISVPAKPFWEDCNKFIDSFNPEGYYQKEVVSLYTLDPDLSKKTLPNFREFEELAFDGLNCQYFFIKINAKYYPVLPRKYFSVLYDFWGTILKQNYIKSIEKDKDQKIGIEVDFYRFVHDRINENRLFGLVSPLMADQNPYKTVFAAAIHSKNKLFLVHITPPATDSNSLNNYLSDLNLELKETQRLLSSTPTKLLLRGHNQIVEFKSKKKEEILLPYFLTVIPYCFTSGMMPIQIPDKFPGEVVGLDDILGIIDELEDGDELSNFIDYLEGLKTIFMSPMTSMLDKFGSFKDSKEVLIRGARNPTGIMIDLNWGSNIRYRSLSKFWQQFPAKTFFGHPRSWRIYENKGYENAIVLKSRKFFGYAYYIGVGNSIVFINSPVDSMNSTQVKVADLIMQIIFDGLTVYKSIINKMSFATVNNKLQVLIFPNSLVKDNEKFVHVKHLIPEDEFWLMDITEIGINEYGIRVVFNQDKVVSSLQNPKDRTLEITVLINILEQIETFLIDKEFLSIKAELLEENIKKARFRLFSIAKQVSFPESINPIVPEGKEYKMADKKIAQVASGVDIKPGKYSKENAKIVINSLIENIVTCINSEISKYSLNLSIPVLIEKLDALINEHDINKYMIKESFDQEVDYPREDKATKIHLEFLLHYKNYRYLIEKFVQIHPKGDKELNNTDLGYLLALTDRILSLYVASDSIQYEIYAAEVEIADDFLTYISYNVDIKSLEKKYGEEKSKIDLGIIGKKDDFPKDNIPLSDYLEELDKAFKNDFDFGFKDLINMQQIMAMWAIYNKNMPESTYYFATCDEINKVCLDSIQDYDSTKTNKLLKFLTLDPNELLKVQGETNLSEDLPVWEYNKRLSRYSIRPLIKIENNYFWGPHSVDRAGKIWANISHAKRLPANINAPSVWKLLKKGHEERETSLCDKIEEITKRYSNFVVQNMYPHKLDSLANDIGDIDVLVLLEAKNIILNIESKIIDPAYCLKDLKRIREKIFGRIKTDGSFEGGYLQKVEKRAEYLKQKWADIINKLNWKIPNSPPKIISIFSTQTGFWWTEFPTKETEVIFIEVRLLDDTIKKLK